LLPPYIWASILLRQPLHVPVAQAHFLLPQMLRRDLHATTTPPSTDCRALNRGFLGDATAFRGKASPAKLPLRQPSRQLLDTRRLRLGGAGWLHQFRQPKRSPLAQRRLADPS